NFPPWLWRSRARARHSAANQATHPSMLAAFAADLQPVATLCSLWGALQIMVIPGLGGAESSESMNTGLWKMDSGLAACRRRPGMTAIVLLLQSSSEERPTKRPLERNEHIWNRCAATSRGMHCP